MTLNGSTTSTPAPRARVQWLDAARAFAVLAVLLGHYQVYIMVHVNPDPSGIERLWPTIVHFLQPVRMPLLLFMSGMLASSRLLTSATGGFSRAISSFYLNAIWVTIYFLIAIPLRLTSSGSAKTVGEWLTHIVLPSENLWFIWALGFWALCFTFLRKLPMPLVLTAFALTGIAGDLLRGEIPPRAVAVLIYGIFFALGVYARDIMFKFVQAQLLPKIAVLGASYLALREILSTKGLDPVVRSLTIDVRSIVAIAAAVCIFALLVRMNWFARPMAFIGRHTLSIFVVHLPLTWLIMNPGPLRDALTPAGAEFYWPVFGMIFLVGGCLLFEWAARKIGARHLFDPPEWLLPITWERRRGNR